VFVNETPSSTPPPRKRLVGCLVKGPLGCASFLIGAAAIFTLFLPWACGRTARRDVEELFTEHFEGELALGHTWLFSLYGPQWVNGVELHDPEGDLVLKGRMQAPKLLSLVCGALQECPDEWGPVELRVERLHLLADESGITNLERALALRESGKPFPIDLQAGRKMLEIRHRNRGIRLTTAGDVTLQIEVGRLTYSNPETIARGRELRIEDLELSGRIGSAAGGRFIHLGGEGLLPLDPLTGLPGKVTIEGRLDRFRSLHVSPATAVWSLTIGTGAVDTADLEILLGTGGRLAALFGPRLTGAEVVLRHSGEGELFLEHLSVESEAGTLRVTGGELLPGGVLESGEEGGILLDFPLESRWMGDLLRPFLPLCREVASDDSAARGSLELKPFLLAEGLRLEGLSGQARLELPSSSSWRLPPSLVGEFPRPARQVLGGRSVFLTSRIEEGVFHYERQRLSSRNAQIAYDGALDLRRDDLQLIVSWPVSWPAIPAVEAGQTQTRVTGSLDGMAVAPLNR
jgi:hypothetical protein